MTLTDARCRNEKPGETRKKLSDGRGLQLWIQTNGTKLWQLVYHFQGRQRQIALGPYPDVPLSEARAKRDEAKALLRTGRDPVAVWRPAAPPKPIGETFREVASEYLERRRREKLADVTMAKKEWLLDLAYPDLGEKKVSDIRPVDVLRVLQDVEERGCFETARRLRATIGAVCRYAVITARAENDPTIALRGAIAAPKVTSRAAIIDPEAFGGLLRAIENFDGQPTTIAGLKLMALLFPRPGELRLAKWPEFDFGRQVWTIPATRTKMRREHQIYLAPQALAVLTELQKITGHGDFLFPALWGRGRPISENTLNLALRRMGYGPEEMTSHGFRASASTMLNESGRWTSDAIERQLAHIERNAVRRAYARGLHWDERVLMMSWWAEYIDTLKRNAIQKQRGTT